MDARRESEWRWFGWAAFLTLAAWVAMSGCASVPINDEPTIPFSVDNGLIDEAAVYVNGAFVGRVEGEHTAPLKIRQSLLARGGCISVRIRTMWAIGQTDEQCVRRGGRFTLTITKLSVMLTPWDR